MANSFKNYVARSVANISTATAVTELITGALNTQTTIIGASLANISPTSASITASAGVAKKFSATASWLSRTSTTATCSVTGISSYLAAGDWFVMVSGTAPFDGVYQAATVSTNSFTYTVAASGATSSSTGTLYVPTYLVKDASIAPGNALVIIGADQKVVLEYDGGVPDVLIAYASAANSASALGSVLEIT